MLFASFLVFIFGFIAIRTAIKAVQISRSILFPIVFILCFIGTYANNSRGLDLIIMTLFGIVGYLMRKSGFSVPAFVIAFLLGPTMESAFKQSLLIGDGELSIFIHRPIAVAFLVLAILSAYFLKRQRDRLKTLGF